MSRPRRPGRGLAVGGMILAVLLMPPAACAEGPPLPDPLTLPEALKIAEESPHPELQQAEAQLAGARAGLALAESRYRPNLNAEGRLRWIEPAELAADQETHDHQAVLRLRQNLYDFGRTAALERTAEAELGGRDAALRDTRLVRRLSVMRRFFDVLLADQAFARENEAMAVAYIELDKLRNRHELEQVSDLDLLASQSSYEAIRGRRALAEAELRTSRLRLALALGRPEVMPGNLAAPELNQSKREPPDEAALLTKALADNATLNALKGRVEAARQRMSAARAEGRPRLEAELEAAAYARELGSYDPWRAGVVLTIPIFTGGAVDANVAKEQAELLRLEGELRAAEFALRQRILELALKLNALKVQGAAVKAEQDYRELYLDRSRALYEMEVRADLGDAMVKLTEAQLGQLRRDFELALAWEELEALTGGPLPQAAPKEMGEKK